MSSSVFVSHFVEKNGVRIVVLIFAIGIIIRTASIIQYPLWIDEAYSVFFSGLSWSELWGDIFKYEIIPPFYYSILKIWRGVFGSSEPALRLLSLLSSAAVPLVLYATARVAFSGREGHWVGLLAVALASGWLYQIKFAEEARPYALLSMAMAFVMLGSLWLLANAGRFSAPLSKVVRSTPGTILVIVGLGVAMALLSRLHNLSVITAALIGMFLFVVSVVQVRRVPGLLQAVLAVGFVCLALYAPYVSTLLFQASSVSKDFWLEAPTLTTLVVDSLRIYSQVPSTWLARNVADEWVVAAIGSLIFLVPLVPSVVGLFNVCRRNGRPSFFWFLLIAAFGPGLVLLILTYAFTPVWLPRTLAHTSVPFILILAALPWGLPERWRTLGVIVVFGLALMGPMILLAKMIVIDPSSVDNHRSYPHMLGVIEHDSEKNIPIVLAPNSLDLPVSYYAKKMNIPNPIHVVPGPYPQRGEQYTYPSGNRGAPAIREEDVESVIEKLETASEIWVITRKLDLFDPNDVFISRMNAAFKCQQDVYGHKPYQVALTRFTRETCDP